MSFWKIAAIGGGLYVLWKLNETSAAVKNIGDAATPIGKVADGISSIIDRGKEIVGNVAGAFGGLSEVAGGNPSDGVSQMSAGENGGWYDGMLWDRDLGRWVDNTPGYY